MIMEYDSYEVRCLLRFVRLSFRAHDALQETAGLRWLYLLCTTLHGWISCLHLVYEYCTSKVRKHSQLGGAACRTYSTVPSSSSSVSRISANYDEDKVTHVLCKASCNTSTSELCSRLCCPLLHLRQQTRFYDCCSNLSPPSSLNCPQAK